MYLIFFLYFFAQTPHLCKHAKVNEWKTSFIYLYNTSCGLVTIYNLIKTFASNLKDSNICKIIFPQDKKTICLIISRLDRGVEKYLQLINFMAEVKHLYGLYKKNMVTHYHNYLQFITYVTSYNLFELKALEKSIIMYL